MRAIATRVAWSLGLLLAVIVLNFTLIQLAPGDVAVVLAGESGAGDPEVIEQIREDYGLNDPFISQVGRYVGKVATGDLGESFFFNQPVTELISARIWPTVLLVGTALIFAIIVGVLVGVFTSRRPESGWSHALTVLALVGFSIPVFFTGLELVILFASVLDLLPVAGMRDVRFEGNWFQAQLDVARHLVLPAFSLSLLYLAQYSQAVTGIDARGFAVRLRAHGAGERAERTRSWCTNTPYATR